MEAVREDELVESRGTVRLHVQTLDIVQDGLQTVVSRGPRRFLDLNEPLHADNVY